MKLIQHFLRGPHEVYHLTVSGINVFYNTRKVNVYEGRNYKEIFPRLRYKKSDRSGFCNNSNKLIKWRVFISLGKHNSTLHRFQCIVIVKNRAMR